MILNFGYLRKEVLKEKDNINDGVGVPGRNLTKCVSPQTQFMIIILLDWKLVLCLLASWGCVLIILVKGIRSSGKASYFLALFPYVGMGILLVRACTLEGAAAGILYFIRPQFDRLLDPSVSNLLFSELCGRL